MCESEPKEVVPPAVDLARLCRTEVLREAWERVRWKNARGGIDGVEPGDLDHRIATVLEKLSRQLEEGTYAPESPVSLWVRKNQRCSRQAVSDDRTEPARSACHAPATKEDARRRSWFGAGRGRGV
jgi:hypothetical protein